MDNVIFVDLDGYDSQYAIKNDNSLWAWGRNNNGQLGDGTNIDRHTPIKVMDNVDSISLSGYGNFAITTDKSVWAWSASGSSAIPSVDYFGNQIERGKIFAPVKILDNTVAIFGAKDVGRCNHAIKTDGSLIAWGTVMGEGVDGISYELPTKIMDNIVSFEIGGRSSSFYALRSDGGLWAWGRNNSGQLGDGTTTNRKTPVKIMDGVKLPSGAPTTTPAPSAPEIKVIVNGVELSFDQPPIIENGRTLVPLRAIFEALGADVEWEQSTQTVTAVRDDITVTLTIGSNILIKNGEEIELDVPAQLIGGRTLVPVRAVAESFGAEVGWDQSTRTVTIIE